MIAEWIIIQVLSNSHKQKQLLDWQHKHKWGSYLEFGILRDSVGMRLGVLGYGNLGRQGTRNINAPWVRCALKYAPIVARVCKAIGMVVIAYTASPRTTLYSKKDKGYIVPGTGDPDGAIPSAWYGGTDKVSLHNFLAQDIDVLLIAVPLTKETQHLLAAREFEILGKKNAFIANISRGSILNQTDLVTFLQKDEQEGGLRGAALDVTDPEPLPPGDPLWDLENVTITPHVSGLSMEYEERSYEILERNLTNLERGKPLLNLVDRKRGY
jgi:phosphoglycerate dehydrogenase-like enzyme